MEGLHYLTFLRVKIQYGTAERNCKGVNIMLINCYNFDVNKYIRGRLNQDTSLLFSSPLAGSWEQIASIFHDRLKVTGIMCVKRKMSQIFFQMRQPRRQPIERGRGARMMSTIVQIRWKRITMSLKSFPKEVNKRERIHQQGSDTKKLITNRESSFKIENENNRANERKNTLFNVRGERFFSDNSPPPFYDRYYKIHAH
jgi:hypothetical protein